MRNIKKDYTPTICITVVACAFFLCLTAIAFAPVTCRL